MVRRNKQNIFQNKLFIAVAAFVILFTIFWGFYSKNYISIPNQDTSESTNISDETAGWETYNHPEGFYALKYPSSMKVKESFPDSNSACETELIIADIDKGFSDNYQGDIVIDVCNVLEEFYPNAAFSNITGDKEKIISIDNKGGYIKTGEAVFQKTGYKSIIKRLVFFENGKEYTIDFRDLMSPEANPANFDQILSTFKFTDSEGAFCGGFAGTACPEGYACRLDGNYPDAAGKCVK